MSGMSKHGYDKQSRVPTAHGRLHVQGTSYIKKKLPKEDLSVPQKNKCGTINGCQMCVREQMQVGPPALFTT